MFILQPVVLHTLKMHISPFPVQLNLGTGQDVRSCQVSKELYSITKEGDVGVFYGVFDSTFMDEFYVVGDNVKK